MAHIHGFLSGEFRLFEDLKSREKEDIFIWLQKCIYVKERGLLQYTAQISNSLLNRRWLGFTTESEPYSRIVIKANYTKMIV